MSLTSTTLVKAIDATQREFKVTAITGFTVGYFVKVDSEMMFLRAVDTDTYWIRVERGQCDTVAVAHAILAPVDVGPAEDFPPWPPRHLYTYSVSGPLTVGPGVHRIFGAAARTMTLRAPYAWEDGMILTLTCGTAYAHVVTLDSGAFNALTDTAIRFAGVIGDTCELLAERGSWMIISTGQNTYFTLPSRSPSVSPSASPSVSPSVSPSKSPSVSPSKSASVSPSAST